MRLLVIEDETSLSTAICHRLRAEGYSVDSATDGTNGLNLVESTAYDCLLLDLGLPGVDGSTILRRARGAGIQTPVLILTARDSVDDRVAAFNIGADDYMSKPFSFDELLVRIKALLRRSHRIGENVLIAADLEVDVMRRVVRRGGRQIDLTSREYSVLEYLVRNKNRLLTRTQIIEHVWHYNFDCISNIVDVYVRYLRRKMDQGFPRRLICTVRGMGYMLRDT
jgi:DNA-binding response OmpR family regulator